MLILVIYVLYFSFFASDILRVDMPWRARKLVMCNPHGDLHSINIDSIRYYAILSIVYLV